jgi:hypothetical protein
MELSFRSDQLLIPVTGHNYVQMCNKFWVILLCLSWRLWTNSVSAGFKDRIHRKSLTFEEGKWWFIFYFWALWRFCLSIFPKMSQYVISLMVLHFTAVNRNLHLTALQPSFQFPACMFVSRFLCSYCVCNFSVTHMLRCSPFLTLLPPSRANWCLCVCVGH